MQFVWPIQNPPKSFSSGIKFGATRTTTATPHAHAGVDLLGPVGTPVFAAAPGTITVAKAITTLGSPAIVYIDHGDGWQTRYMHLAAESLPAKGPIGVGQQIATIGYLPETPHVHFEVRKNVTPSNANGTPVDPERAIAGTLGSGISVLIGLGLAWLVLKRV